MILYYCHDRVTLLPWEEAQHIGVGVFDFSFFPFLLFLRAPFYFHYLPRGSSFSFACLLSMIGVPSCYPLSLSALVDATDLGIRHTTTPLPCTEVEELRSIDHPPLSTTTMPATSSPTDRLYFVYYLAYWPTEAIAAPCALIPTLCALVCILWLDSLLPHPRGSSIVSVSILCFFLLVLVVSVKPRCFNSPTRRAPMFRSVMFIASVPRCGTSYGR